MPFSVEFERPVVSAMTRMNPSLGRSKNRSQSAHFLAGSPNRLKAQVSADHTRSVCETSPAQKAMPPVILNVGLPSTKAPPGASVQPKGSLNFVAARTRKVSGREAFRKEGTISRDFKGSYSK